MHFYYHQRLNKIGLLIIKVICHNLTGGEILECMKFYNQKEDCVKQVQ